VGCKADIDRAGVLALENPSADRQFSQPELCTMPNYYLSLNAMWFCFCVARAFFHVRLVQEGSLALF
jgi:hypothetical protein